MKLELFQNSELNCSIRTVMQNDEPWFVAKDVCDSLEIERTDAAIRNLDTDERGVTIVSTLGGDQKMSIINESGLYSLILRSRKPEAKRFKKWVTSEVLPSIRKHGIYATAPTVEKILDDPDFLIKTLEAFKEEKSKRQALEIQAEQDAPKVLYADTVAGSKSSCLIGELAKLITQKGYKIGQNTLFSWMRDNGYLCVRGENYNMPIQRFVEQGLFEIKKGTRLSGDGTSVMTRTVKVTGKGQIYFIDKFLGKRKDVA